MGESLPSRLGKREPFPVRRPGWVWPLAFFALSLVIGATLHVTGASRAIWADMDSRLPDSVSGGAAGAALIAVFAGFLLAAILYLLVQEVRISVRSDRFVIRQFFRTRAVAFDDLRKIVLEAGPRGRIFVQSRAGTYELRLTDVHIELLRDAFCELIGRSDEGVLSAMQPGEAGNGVRLTLFDTSDGDRLSGKLVYAPRFWRMLTAQTVLFYGSCVVAALMLTLWALLLHFAGSLPSEGDWHVTIAMVGFVLVMTAALQMLRMVWFWMLALTASFGLAVTSLYYWSFAGPIDLVQGFIAASIFAASLAAVFVVRWIAGKLRDTLDASITAFDAQIERVAATGRVKRREPEPL